MNKRIWFSANCVGNKMMTIIKFHQFHQGMNVVIFCDWFQYYFIQISWQAKNKAILILVLTIITITTLEKNKTPKCCLNPPPSTNKDIWNLVRQGCLFQIFEMKIFQLFQHILILIFSICLNLMCTRCRTTTLQHISNLNIKATCYHCSSLSPLTHARYNKPS